MWSPAPQRRRKKKRERGTGRDGVRDERARDKRVRGERARDDPALNPWQRRQYLRDRLESKQEAARATQKKEKKVDRETNNKDDEGETGADEQPAVAGGKEKGKTKSKKRNQRNRRRHATKEGWRRSPARRMLRQSPASRFQYLFPQRMTVVMHPRLLPQRRVTMVFPVSRNASRPRNPLCRHPSHPSHLRLAEHRRGLPHSGGALAQNHPRWRGAKSTRKAEGHRARAHSQGLWLHGRANS